MIPYKKFRKYVFVVTCLFFFYILQQGNILYRLSTNRKTWIHSLGENSYAGPLELQNDIDKLETVTKLNIPTEVIEGDNNEFEITNLGDIITYPHLKVFQKHSKITWDGEYNVTLKNSVEYRRQIFAAFKPSKPKQVDTDCNKIVENNRKEILKAKYVMENNPGRRIAAEMYANTTYCDNFRRKRGYIEHPLSQMELDFPLAFKITAYQDVEQAERLLRVIYRPHNFYCIHVDVKTKDVDRTAFKRIVSCLDNVFIADKSVNVIWGEFSVLEAELLCMKKLWQYKKWKYYINLTEQEFPLKTNREIVAILNALDGANIVDGMWISSKLGYFYRWMEAEDPPPHKIRPVKGSVHIAVNRHFVDFALHDQRSLDFLEWLKKIQIPDQIFYASLNHNPHLGINGSFLGDGLEYSLQPSTMRNGNREFAHSVLVNRCEGKYVHSVCVLGVRDLHKAYNATGLFVNKLDIDFEYLALDCLEELLYKKTWDQYINDAKIDTDYYKHLDYMAKKLVVLP